MTLLATVSVHTHVAGQLLNVAFQEGSVVKKGQQLAQIDPRSFQNSVAQTAATNLEELRVWAPKLLEVLRKLPELKDVARDQQTAGLQLKLKIHRDTAARFGITPLQIDNTLYDAFGRRQVATSFTQLTQNRVLLEVQQGARGARCSVCAQRDAGCH